MRGGSPNLTGVDVALGGALISATTGLGGLTTAGAFTIGGFTVAGFTVAGFTVGGFTVGGFTVAGFTVGGFKITGPSFGLTRAGVDIGRVSLIRWGISLINSLDSFKELIKEIPYHIKCNMDLSTGGHPPQDVYQTQGFVTTSTLFTTDEKRSIVDEVTAIEKWPETPFKWMRYYEPQRDTNTKILCRVENFIPYSPILSDLLTKGNLPQVLCEIASSDGFCLYKDKINFKLAGASGFAPHQDSPAFSSQGQKNHITALIAVDPMTVDNGCLEIATNRSEIWKERQTLPHTVKGSIIDEVVKDLQWKPILLEPGDVVFFGSYIPHRSGPNITSKPRRALYITYNAASEGDRHTQYYIDKRKAFPPECEREPGKDYTQGAKVYNFGNPIFD